MSQLQEKLLVSAIIPTYNRADLVARAIKSVIQQTYDNLEIIVVDDASKDNTEAVVKAIGDPRIRYIRHPDNRGGAGSRNTGIDAAKGEYIAFLDSDDVWLPNKIEWQLAAIQNHPHPDKVVSHTQLDMGQGEKASIWPTRGKKETEALADYFFISGEGCQTSTVMMSRNLASATRFRPELKQHQEIDLCLRLEMNGAIFTFIEYPLTVWDTELRSDRISLTYDYRLSINWIREYQSLISPKATKGFLIRLVVPKMIASEQDQLYALKLILDAALERLISPQEFIQLIARLMIPKNIRKRLKLLVKQ